MPEDEARQAEEEQLQYFKKNNEARFYEATLPSVNQLVMVKVMRVAETAAYVQLLEYSGVEGMILFSEVSTRRIRSMLKEIRAGQFAVCVVLRVEAERGYIDLSRRRVQPEDRTQYLLTYARSKLVHSTLRQLSAQHDISMDFLCRNLAWPLYKKHGHAVDAFKQFINSRDEKIFADLNLDDKVKKDMYIIIEKKLTPQAMKLKAKIEVSCFEPAGIEAVKAALLAGLDQDSSEVSQESISGAPVMGKITIKVVASPNYDVTTQSIGKEAGLAAIDKSLERIQAKIKEFNGNFALKAKPQVMNADDEEIAERDLDSGGSDTEEDGSDEEEDETMGKFDAEAAFAGKK